jgi:PmbA protein
MLSPDQALDRAQALVERARRAGADAADAAYSGGASESVQVRLGLLEDVERSEGEHIDLRVFVGSRSASIGSSDLSDAALGELAERAVDMARAAPEDPYAGLAAAGTAGRGPFPDLDLATRTSRPRRSCASWHEPPRTPRARWPASPIQRRRQRQRRQARLRARHQPRLRGCLWRHQPRAVRTVIAGEGADKQRDYAWRRRATAPT